MFFSTFRQGHSHHSDGRRQGSDSLHGEVDVALDPFPFKGGTTTCEALWLGVPLVTCTGGPGSFAPRFASRMGLACLKAIGLLELATANETDYVRIAIELARDPARLAALRLSLRERMPSSPLTDEPRFVQEVEAGYRAMWGKWCARPPAAPAGGRGGGI